MFALFGRPFSGGEEVIQAVRFNAGLELAMKPIEHLPTMAALDLTPSFANGDVALPLPLQAVALLLQEDIGQHGQGPEAQESDRTRLILIPAQLFLAIARSGPQCPTEPRYGRAASLGSLPDRLLAQ
jgi:hypothetical protein